MPGFGCACLAWTLMGSTWVLSLGLDSMFHLLGFFRTAKTLWRATIIKDITLSALVLLLALTEQIGILNSCYCLSGAAGSNDHPSIELSFTVDRDPGTKKLWIATPVTALVLILGFILSLEFAYSDARTLLNRCQTEIEDNILKINMLRDLSKLKTG
ncbi:hypothetical protein GQ53DRAFT_756448 [Thozetella sp. PMI_491]|nr:hypothetical protein GQ53DRAFT_756448 [Thozetella sp. PMI_491]